MISSISHSLPLPPYKLSPVVRINGKKYRIHQIQAHGQLLCPHMHAALVQKIAEAALKEQVGSDKINTIKIQVTRQKTPHFPLLAPALQISTAFQTHKAREYQKNWKENSTVFVHEVESFLHSLKMDLSPHFKSVLLRMPLDLQVKLNRLIKQISREEKYLLEYILTFFDFNDLQDIAKFEEILKGAYVIIEDQGQAFEVWKEQLPNKKRRFSSHQSNNFQYALQGKIVGEFLFSTKVHSQKTVSWFQLERYSTSTILETILHLWCWLLYILTKKNQGPFGRSIYTENNPLILKSNKILI